MKPRGMMFKTVSEFLRTASLCFIFCRSFLFLFDRNRCFL